MTLNMTLKAMELTTKIYTAYENGTMQELVNELHNKKHAMFYVGQHWEYAGIDLDYANLIVQIDTPTMGEVLQRSTGEKLFYLPQEIAGAIHGCGRQLFTTGEIDRDRVMKIG